MGGWAIVLKDITYHIWMENLYTETIADFMLTYMHEKSRCRTANLTIRPETTKHSPFHSCLEQSVITN